MLNCVLMFYAPFIAAYFIAILVIYLCSTLLFLYLEIKYAIMMSGNSKSHAT